MGGQKNTQAENNCDDAEHNRRKFKRLFEIGFRWKITEYDLHKRRCDQQQKSHAVNRFTELLDSVAHEPHDDADMENAQ